MIPVLFSLFCLVYFGFTAFTIYMVLISKRANEGTFIGKLIWHHGQAWIVGMVLVVVLTAAIIFSAYLTSLLKAAGLFSIGVM